MTRILGIDYGTKRIGLAITDGLGLTARPLDVIPRAAFLERLGDLVAEYEVETVVMGLPTGLSGGEGVSAAGARELAAEIEASLDVVVEYIDERFTSRMADEALLSSGMKRQQRREKVDKVAAAIILQTYLDRKPVIGNANGDDDVESPDIK